MDGTSQEGCAECEGGTLSALRGESLGGVCTLKMWGPQEEGAPGASLLEGPGRTRKVQGMESKVEKLYRIFAKDPNSVMFIKSLAAMWENAGV